MPLDLTQRRLEPELMDQPGLDANLHRQALRGLRRINWWSRSPGIVWPAIRRTALALGQQSCRVLDIACGGGDVAIAIAHRGRAANLPLQVHGVDMSATALEHARQSAANVTNVSFQQLDIFREPLPQDYDVVMCSLFLHHLTNTQAIELLRNMAAAARRLVLVNDLRRSRLGYALAWWGGRLLTRSPIVHADGPQSVAAAFTCEEALALAHEAGLAGATIRSCWPQRFLLRWSQP